MKIGNCGESSAEQERRLRKRLWCARTIEDPEQKLLTRPASLEMYRKREGARRMHEHGVFARFRYNDLKEAARGCGGRGPYANSMV
jgi:hypothetical protein